MRESSRVFLIAALLVASPVLIPARPAYAAGHFIVEGNVGVTSGLSSGDTTDAGAFGSALLGVGGRPRGGWLRVFAVLETAFVGYSRTHEQNLREVTLDRSLFDVGLGVRLVAPLGTPHLRAFLDMMAVLVGSSTTFEGERLATTESTELGGGMRFATGLQWRPVDLFSVGARFSLTSVIGGFDDEGTRGWLVDYDTEDGHWEATLALTFYF